ncbi:MAG TPA: DUF2807 domain-containing protein [Rhizomicrobium sp.]|jgi:opacity protein-like surface antigen|nr:DUF2807 domain-containing protein [Rhizomicrobium sp.]
MRKTLFLGAAVAALLMTAASAATVVPLAPFKSVGLSGDGEVILKHGDVQSVTLIKGSTQFTRLTVKDGGNLEIDACDNNCPHNYDLQVEIVSPSISAVAISGGGSIHAEGAFPASPRLEAAVSGGGEIDARAMPAAKIEAAVDGGGAIKVSATASLNAAVSGGGEIKYWGNPTVSQAVSGGGEVSHASAP